MAVNICEKNHESVWGRDVGEYTYIVAGRPRCVIVRRLKSHLGRIKSVDRFTEKNLATDGVRLKLVARFKLKGSHW